MTFSTRGSSRPRRPLSKLTVVETGEFENYKIKRYENDTIEVVLDGQIQSMAKPHLRNIARQIGVDIDYDVGKAKNTRLLGAHIIRKLET